MDLLVGMLIGVLGTVIVGFFVWRNNKKKFMKAVLNVNDFMHKNDTEEELAAKLDKALAELRADVMCEAINRLNKLG